MNTLAHLLTALLFTLAGCQADTQSIVPPPQNEEPAALEAEEPRKEPATKTTGHPTITESDGKSMDNHWLVILGAMDDQGALPKGWENTSAKLTQQGIKPVATWSSYFKGLMPCWNILVGGSFATKQEAKTLTQKLKKAGINNYFKHAGKFVGKDPRVEQACQRQATFMDRALAFFPVVQWDNRALIPVAAGEAIVERALVKAGPQRAVDGNRQVWLSNLIPLSVGNLNVGQRIITQSTSPGAPPRPCKIKRFVSLTWGQPHFSWQNGNHTEPGCGKPQVMAQLDCELRGEGTVAMAYFPGTTLSIQGILDPQSFDVKAPLDQHSISGLPSQPKVEALRKAGQDHANDQGEALKSQFKMDPLGSDSDTLQHVRYFTGEAWTNCGGDDFDQRLSAVIRNGKLSSNWIDTTWDTIQAVIEHDAKSYLLITTAYGSIGLQDQSGQTVTGINRMFCDCEC
jgi:hypothetical protein